MYRVYNVASLSLHCSIRSCRLKELHNGPGLPDLLIFAKREGHLTVIESLGELDEFDANHSMSYNLTC